VGPTIIRRHQIMRVGRPEAARLLHLRHLIGDDGEQSDLSLQNLWVSCSA